jgi:hypothetical protein
MRITRETLQEPQNNIIRIITQLSILTWMLMVSVLQSKETDWWLGLNKAQQFCCLQEMYLSGKEKYRLKVKL